MSSEVTSPFGVVLDVASGGVEPEGPVTERRVSDLEGLFKDGGAYRRARDGGDALVYRVVGAPVPEVPGEVPFSVTTIEPGDVGGELYMTKGHAHTAYEGEVYVGLSGRGLLLLYSGEEARWVEISPGRVGYIPPGWAHRTVNVGEEPFRFLAVYPGGAGHDYDFVEEHGMGARVFRSGKGYEVVDLSAGAEGAV